MVLKVLRYVLKCCVGERGVFVPFLGRFGDGSCLSSPNVDTRAVNERGKDKALINIAYI